MKSKVALFRGVIAAKAYWCVRFLIILALPLLAVLSGNGRALAGQPNLSNVSDILQGEQYLLRDDDVIFQQGTFSNSDYSLLQTLVPSANSNFSTPVLTFGASLTNPGFTPVSTMTLARVYNAANDVILTAGQQSANGNFVWSVNLRDPKSLASFNQQIPADFAPFPLPMTTAMQLAKGDFAGNGFEGAAVAYVSNVTPPVFGMNVVVASDVNSTDSPLTIGPAYTSIGNSVVPLVGALVAGDFAGNGQYGLAALMSDYQTVQLFAVNPQTLQITVGQSVQLPFALASGNATLVAGRFNDASHDQLAAIGQVAGAKKFAVISIAIDRSTLAPTVGQAAFLNVKSGSVLFPISNVIGKAAPLTGNFGVQDQLIIGLTSELFGGIIQIGSFDDTMLFHRASVSQTSTTEPTCLYSLEAGNFDNRNSGGQRVANFEIAAFYLQGNNDENFTCPGAPSGPQTFFGEIYQLNTSASDWLVPTNSYTLSTLPDGLGGLVGAQMIIGDTQGRSLRLGKPDKVVVNAKIQPDIALGIPPMHVDYIRPNFVFNPTNHPGCQDPNTPCNLNLTVRPSVPAPGTGFATEFDFASTSSMESHRTTTTSYGFGIKASNNTKVSYGLPFVGSLSVDVKASVQDTHDRRVGKAFNTYNSRSDSLTATTGFADHLFFTQSRQNIYYYPVIAQMICPAALPNCTADQKTQLYVAFSAPDLVSPADLDVTTLDWYEPGHEPGNVLTYPWDLNHLQNQYTENLSPQTSNPAPCRGTDTSKVSYSTSWSSGSGKSQSSGSSNAFSADASLTVTGSAFGVSDQASVGVSDSTSMTTLQESTQTLSASEGITITKPVFGTDVASCCLYDFGSYLFGLGNPNGTFQNFNLTSHGQPIEVQTTGPLVVGFVANPTPMDGDELSCGGAPGWWQQVYNLPDVGVLHPERWNWLKSSKTVSFNAIQPGVSPLNQPFYHASGFFITSHGTSGPTLSEARQGDQLSLTSQIFNFSLRDTDDPTLTVPAASVHVRFYGQIYNAGVLAGNSFLIGETTLPYIPALKSTRHTDGANWRYASVNFDTSPYAGGQYVVFWTVTWMEDANGNLVPEMPDHGLAANPANLSFNQVTEVPTQAHGNNLGMYPVNSPFFIADKNSPFNGSQGAEILTIDDLALAGTTIRDRRGQVDLRLHATSAPASDVTVSLFQRGPGGKRKLIALQQVPYIAADSDYMMHAIIRPALCGATRIIATATASDGATVTSLAPARIACRDPRRP